MKESSIVLQRRFRANLLARKNRTLFLKKKASSLVLQRRFRANQLARKNRDMFLKMKVSAIVLQRRFRANLLARKKRAMFLKMKASAIVLQRRFRANLLARKNRVMFLKLKASAIVMQRRFRANRIGQNQRQDFLKLRNAAVKIQRRLRANRLGKIQRKKFLKIKTSIIFVQRKFRENHLILCERELFIKMKSAAIILQRRFRSKVLIKHKRQAFLLQDKTKAAIKIQAAWRGKMVRQRVVVPRPQVNPTDVEMFRQPIINRGQHFIPILIDFSKYSVGELLKALYNLDEITRLSPNQCENVTSSGTVQVLYALLAITNKAVGIDRCIELTLLILSNLFKAPTVSATVWKETLDSNGIELLVELMMKFRLEKTSSVFCKAATLIWLFAQDPEKTVVIKKTPKFKHMFSYIMKCMDKGIQQAKKHSSKQAKHKKLPPVGPDWGNYFNLPRAFNDKIHALLSVMKALNFSC